MWFKKIVIFLLCIFANTFAITSFVFINKINLEVAADYFPGLSFSELYAIDGEVLKNPSSQITWNSQNPVKLYSFFVIDRKENKILFNQGDNNIASYGNNTGDVQFNSPSDIVVNEDGDIYVSDTGNNRIVKLHTDGYAITDTGIEIQAFGPVAIALDTENNIYAAYPLGKKIIKYDSSGTELTTFSTVGSYQLSGPLDITIDNEMNLYILDPFSPKKIFKLDKNGLLLKAASSEETGINEDAVLTSITADSYGNLYILNLQNSQVIKINKNLEYLSSFGRSGTGDYEFYNPAKIECYGKNGFISVCSKNDIKFYAIGSGLSRFEQSHYYYTPGENADDFVFNYFISAECLVSSFIKTKDNEIVKLLEDNLLCYPGEREIKWDGRDNFGNYLSPDNYQIQIIAKVNVEYGFSHEYSESFVISPALRLDIKSISPKVITDINQQFTFHYLLSYYDNAHFYMWIKDKNGESTIRTLHENTSIPKDIVNTSTWDLRDSDNQTVADGIYTLSILVENNDSWGADQIYELFIDKIPVKIESYNIDSAFAPKKNNMGITFSVNEQCYADLEIYNKNSILIRKLAGSQLINAGENHFEWNGKNDYDQYVPEDKYKIKLKVTDITGNSQDEIASDF